MRERLTRDEKMAERSRHMAYGRYGMDDDVRGYSTVNDENSLVVGGEVPACNLRVLEGGEWRSQNVMPVFERETTVFVPVGQPTNR